jgi:TonB-dependent receptor
MYRFLSILPLLFLCFTFSAAQNQDDIVRDVDLNSINLDKLSKSLVGEISIQIEDLPMRLALNEIAQKGSLNLNYNSDIIPVNQKVSITAKRINPIEALLIVLKQTSSKLQITRSGSLIILPADEPKGKIKGVIMDANTSEPLVGANVVVSGTSIGTSTDLEGEFNLPDVKAGEYELSVTYIGYKDKKVKVNVESGRTTNVMIDLEWAAIEGDVITVTVQARGQLAAINEQLAADQIKNVVSKDRIRELPNANAAESVARLPGVSIVRYGGEGAKVVIRGLSPKYNRVMVDGVQMASTSSGDRSVNMSMISSYSLEGIEVIKAPTADMDANQVGGSVNFKLKTADEGLKYDLVAQGGYNHLRESYDDYMFVGNVSDRFFNNKLGVFVQANMEKKNLGSNQMGAWYDTHEKVLNVKNKVYTESLSLIDVYREIKRYGGTLTMDYLLPEGQVYFKNFFSKGETSNSRYSEYFGVASKNHSYTTTDRQGSLLVYNNILGYKQQFSLFDLNAKISHSYSESKTPTDVSFSFLIPSDLTGITNEDVENMLPQDIPHFAQNNTNAAYFTNIRDMAQLTQGRDLMALLDFGVNFRISKQISGKIKFGGKMIATDRSYDYGGYGGVMNLGSGTATKNAILEAFPWMQETTPLGSSYMPYSLFIDHNFSHGDFLNGKYPMGPVVDIDLMHKVIDVMRGVDEVSPETYNYLDMSSKTHDYSGTELLRAGYLMANINITDQIKFIPGVRYEYKETSYTGVRGNSSAAFPESHYQCSDTTTERTNEHFFPMIHLLYKPLDWLQFRLAYTKTISRPNFNMIVPRRDIGKTTIHQNNYMLEPEIADNYDIYVAISNNYIGLFSIGGFIKNINNMIFPMPQRVILDVNEYGLDPIQNGKNITTQENNKNLATVKGFELDWQTNFWYLPSVLKGLVLNVNYTHMFSEAMYPRTVVTTEYLMVPPYGVVKTNNDTTYADRLYNQPDDILNFAVGYDYKGFSCRLSMLYQSNVFTGPNFWPELRSYTDDYWRWDFAVKQRLPWYGLQVYLNIYNLTETMDRSINAGTGLPTWMEHYGRTIQLGLRMEMGN